MTLQRVKTVFDGKWIESWRYIDYRLLDVYVPISSSFQEFANGRCKPIKKRRACRRQKSDGGKATVEGKLTVEKLKRKLRSKNEERAEGGKPTVDDKATVKDKQRGKLWWKNGRGREGGNAPGSL
ncbi:hypothetical protein E5676_scaffold767G00630 [Cucumis melo var. makuwa]|uniref:Uncharacterized protein n=1 Tax=Cucumis melo var. makuwa TaxID=1194695 RepID=A0A5D3B6E5_CUCMM|nr:hypothetical protein E5676_scaffold767G00630 [Cucumis melo var. makuwa]